MRGIGLQFSAEMVQMWLDQIRRLGPDHRSIALCTLDKFRIGNQGAGVLCAREQDAHFGRREGNASSVEGRGLPDRVDCQATDDHGSAPGAHGMSCTWRYWTFLWRWGVYP